MHVKYLTGPKTSSRCEDHTAGYCYCIDPSQIHRCSLAGDGMRDRLAMHLQTSGAHACSEWQKFKLFSLSNLARNEGTCNDRSKSFHRKAAIYGKARH